MATNNLPAIKKAVMSDTVQASIRARLGEKAGTFTTSLLDLMGDDKYLAQCEPNLVIKEALKAAGLDLPVNKNLGFAYVIAYKEKGVLRPSFQMGYKGYIQLAIRTGQYRHLNAGEVYEGEEIIEDRIKGTIEISGKKTSDKVIGYFSYMELMNGFNKAIAWTKNDVEAHAKRFSKSYNSAVSPWKTDFDAMAKKTLILQLIPKYGPLTIEMSTAMISDRGGDFKGFDPEREIDNNANQDVIDIEPGEMTDQEKADIQSEEAKQNGPDF